MTTFTTVAAKYETAIARNTFLLEIINTITKGRVIAKHNEELEQQLAELIKEEDSNNRHIEHMELLRPSGISKQEHPFNFHSGLLKHCETFFKNFRLNTKGGGDYITIAEKDLLEYACSIGQVSHTNDGFYFITVKGVEKGEIVSYKTKDGSMNLFAFTEKGLVNHMFFVLFGIVEKSLGISAKSEKYVLEVLEDYDVVENVGHMILEAYKQEK